MWWLVLVVVATVVVISSALALRAGTHPGKGHCGPMCTLGTAPTAAPDRAPERPDAKDAAVRDRRV